MDERVLRPYRTLELFAADELSVALEKMRQRARRLRPKPHAPSVLEDLPRCTVEFEQVEPSSKAIERHPVNLLRSRRGYGCRQDAPQDGRKSSEYTTSSGTLTMREMGLTEPPNTSNPESGVVNAFQRIVSGTGEFAGATGYLFVSGFDPTRVRRRTSHRTR